MGLELLNLAIWALFGTQISAQALVAALSSHQELSKFNAYVQSFPRLLDTLNQINNYTVFAPSDTAITTWLNTISLTSRQDDIEAILSYHILHGGWPTASFSSTPQFAVSYLSNSSYVNVTGGVAVELIDTDGTPTIQSAVKANISMNTAVSLIRNCNEISF
jgi:uncharacterized surface protein with fasciclin (FAS1) repeats